MEDRKTLWIIIGIGVCVIVVVAVGFFWFLPTEQSINTAGETGGAVNTGSAGFDAVEWVRQDDTFPGLEEPEENTEEFVVVADELVYGLPENETETETETETAETPQAEGGTITLEIPESEPVKEVPVVDIQPAAPVKTAAVEKPAVPDAKKAEKITEYWIQAGSFSTLSKASDVKARLTENGASSTISTTNVNGTDYYRVRLGPYADQNEADKFLSWIKAVKGFEGSYISEVYVTR
ncbi:MAG: SPOR domain-containing protein [Spirochaetales bacterium]|uniref:SPOR domain-containing protein n=1 Tax=Candidatus Thalassospirochaeta sargassi TaxID=3119039 RepID=A0AAJ1MPK0_9SPIO|nr:SPOR domain-containing protein [Spirochaetales bacterium]